MCRRKVCCKEYKMNNGISVHILASLSWECGNVMKEQDHNYQMEDKNTPFPMPYFRAQWLGQFFSPGIFKGLVFSKQLLDTHIHTLRTWGFTTFHRQTAENLCHSSTHTWPDPTGRLTLQQCDSPHRALQTTLYIVPQHRCWTSFICVYLIPHHLPGGDLKPCIDFYFFNCWRRKLFKNKL